MKLFYSPFHTFIHKVLVTAHEAGLWDELTFVPTYPYKNRQGEDQGDRYSLAPINPLNKVPTLVLDDGQVVWIDGTAPLGHRDQVVCDVARHQALLTEMPGHGDLVQRLTIDDQRADPGRDQHMCLDPSASRDPEVFQQHVARKDVARCEVLDCRSVANNRPRRSIVVCL